MPSISLSYLRYYYASRLNGRDENIDLDFADFKAKIDSDLVGKVVNLASRTTRFVDQLSATYPDDGGLFCPLRLREPKLSLLLMKPLIRPVR